MIETILALTIPVAYGLFRLIVIMILVIGLKRFFDAVNHVNFSRDQVFTAVFQTIAAAILISGSIIALAIMYSS